MKTLTSNEIYNKILEILENTQNEIKLASAWIWWYYLEKILDIINKKWLYLEIIIRWKDLNDLFESSDKRIFSKLSEIKNKKIYISDRLHAKFIISDNKYAVVWSANFTYSWLSQEDKWNIEAWVYYEEINEIEKLKDYFEKIKKEYSYEVDENISWFILNPSWTINSKIVIIDDLNENDFFIIKENQKIILWKIKKIYTYNSQIIRNPFDPQNFLLDNYKKIFDWTDNLLKKISFLILYNNWFEYKIGIAQIFWEIINWKIERLKNPLKPWTPVYKVSKEIFNYFFENWVYIWDYNDINLKINIDEINKRHLFICWTTWSWKSTFVKNLINNINDRKIIVFDVHWEYTNMGKVIDLKNVFTPIDFDDIKNLFENCWLWDLVDWKSKEGKTIKKIYSNLIGKFHNSKIFEFENIDDFLSKIDYIISDDKDENKINYIKQVLLDYYWEEYFNFNYIKEIFNNLEDDKIILNFSKIRDDDVKLNIWWMILKYFFDMNKNNIEKRLFVIEEAHNFAPEKWYGDATKDNFSLQMLKKIAAEGRKFWLWLIIISQRPSQVNKYVLSQMNNQVIFKIINSWDIDSIKITLENFESDYEDLLPFLQTWEFILWGNIVPFSIIWKLNL